MGGSAYWLLPGCLGNIVPFSMFTYPSQDQVNNFYNTSRTYGQ
jgi:hypothetical protein